MGEDVYEVLLSQIISLKIAPQERISVDSLARELGVSQTPIRAALIRLEAEGLVVKKHNVGYSAAPTLSARDFEEIYEMRMLLEPAAAEIATRNMNDTVAQRLQQAHDRMCELESEQTKRSYSKFARFDAEFHAIIAEASGNSLIVDTLGRLLTHTHLFRSRRHSAVTREAVSEHSTLLNAMLRGDAAGAKWAMAEHINHSRERIVPFTEAGL
nr:GntR family transcriptional regulator [Halomonas socia]